MLVDEDAAHDWHLGMILEEGTFLVSVVAVVVSDAIVSHEVLTTTDEDDDDDDNVGKVGRAATPATAVLSS